MALPDDDEEDSEPVLKEDNGECPYTKAFIRAYPYYSYLGMTYADFWYREPWLVRVYRERHKIELESRSQEMWLQGAYVFDAVSKALANFGQGLSKKSQRKKPQQYMEKPLRLTPLSEAEKREEQKKAQKKLIAQLSRWEKRFNKEKESGNA